MGSLLTPAQVEQLQRARVLGALTEVVAERGYAETTVADVTAHGALSRKTFYELYGNKAEAFFAAYDALLARAIRAMEAACPPGDPPELRVAAGLAELLGLLERQPSWARLCVVEAQTASAIAGEHDRHLRPIVAWVHDVHAELGIPPRLGAAEEAAMVLGVLRVRLAGPPRGLDDLLPRFFELTTGVGADALPPRERWPRPPALSQRAVAMRAALDAGERRTTTQLLVDAVVDADPAPLRLLVDRCPRDDELHRLARAGLRGGPASVLYTSGHAGRGTQPLSRQLRRVLEHVAAHPGTSGRETWRAVGIRTESQVCRLLGQLRRRGLVEDAEPGGRTRCWRATAAGEDALER